jgi:hypothetical protein
VSDKIIHLAKRLPKARNLPEGDELGIFMLHKDGEASAWVSEKVQTRQQWNYILDFLDKLRDRLARVRDEGSR